MFSIDAIIKRLDSLGYEMKSNDTSAVEFCFEKVTNTIRNEINFDEVPEGLENVAIEMATGEFLLAKRTFAPDDLDNLDLDYAVKQIQAGDTNTVFAIDGVTPEQKLNAFINYLLSYGKAEFNAFRRVRW